ncbi:MAG TPA: DUF885 domain-containing protein, partial [Anaerolineales bacterium]|nr:DUF885 domain-containing protein [Anaerolineales bacterium]
MPAILSPLHQLFQEHWEAWTRFDPLFATYVGEQRYNDSLPVATEDAFQAWHDQLVDYHKRLQTIPLENLTPTDQLNHKMFGHLLEDEVTELSFHPYRLPMSRTAGFHIMFPDMFQEMPFNSVEDYENYISRMNAFPRFALENIDLMRTGLRTGYLPPLCTLTDLDKQLNAHIVEDATQSALYHPFKQYPDSISKMQRQKLREDAQKAILESVVPGYGALLEFFTKEYQPAARESIASTDLPDGEAFYAHRIHYFTSLHLSAMQVHQIGLDEVKRIRAEMDLLLKKIDWQGTMEAFVEFLRTDPKFYVTTPEALLEKTALVLKRMDGELTRLFKSLPRMPYGIRAVPDYAAEGETAGYYNPGLGDGTRAGMYYVNTYDLPSRPIYE